MDFVVIFVGSAIIGASLGCLSALLFKLEAQARGQMACDHVTSLFGVISKQRLRCMLGLRSKAR